MSKYIAPIDLDTPRSIHAPSVSTELIRHLAELAGEPLSVIRLDAAQQHRGQPLPLVVGKLE